MSSRRRFIATGAVVTGAIAAFAASVFPNTGSGKDQSPDHPDRTPGSAARVATPEDDRDSSRALRRARSRAAIGQSVPFPES